MAQQIIWSPRAADNLEDICRYIARDSRYYARLFARRVLAVIKSLPEFPKSGRVVPEYADENIREKIYENYRIVYRLKKDRIEIAAICHGAKMLENIL